jgi:acyl-CoA thioesterase
MSLILQFKSPGAQAAFEAYLESYHQVMMPPQINDPSQIQASLEMLARQVSTMQRAEQNLKAILSPSELRQFKAFQEQQDNDRR